MTGTANNEVIKQEGGGQFSYTASGTVYAGQFVYPVGTEQVKAAGARAANVVGVAMIGATDGEPVSVAGPGNIVTTVASGGITCGDNLTTASTGFAITFADHKASGSSVVGIALEAGTDATDFNVLLI